MGGILKARECAVNQALTPARQFLLKEMDSFVSLPGFLFFSFHTFIFQQS